MSAETELRNAVTRVEEFRESIKALKGPRYLRALDGAFEQLQLSRLILGTMPENLREHLVDRITSVAISHVTLAVAYAHQIQLEAPGFDKKLRELQTDLNVLQSILDYTTKRL